ncbi:MAG: pirin family protein [Candidatus Phosphoribacter sp.]
MDAPRDAPRDAPTGLVVLDAIDAQISPRDAVLRFLPHRGRRMVGAWCFVDVYGPWAIGAGEPGMTVPPHSHIGLQTLSWVLDGEVLHRDSLGTTATVTPGYAALMTAGLGIAHSENTPDGHCGRLHGAQLWIALPDAVRARPPSFELVGPATQVPIEGATAHVFAGTLAGRSSRLTEGSGLHSPLVGAEWRGCRSRRHTSICFCR